MEGLKSPENYLNKAKVEKPVQPAQENTDGDSQDDDNDGKPGRFLLAGPNRLPEFGKRFLQEGDGVDPAYSPGGHRRRWSSCRCPSHAGYLVSRWTLCPRQREQYFRNSMRWVSLRLFFSEE